MIKAILFDMDGVLIDAKDWHYEALNKALSHFGYNISRDNHLSTYDGLPTRDKLKMLTKIHGLPSGLHSFINQLKQLYTIEYCNNHCKPTFNHQYCLSKLKNDGYKIAVCSNSIRSSIIAMMDKSNLTQYLDLILSNQDVKDGKPSPEIYTKAMSILEVDPSECLILEDNEHGIAAANASGGHLMKINIPDDVRYKSIASKINSISR